MLKSVRSFLATPRSSAINPDRIALARGRDSSIYVLLALSVFAVLLNLVRQNKTAATDAAITLRAQKANHPYFDRLMKLVSWPGYPPQSRIIPGALAALLWSLGLRLEAIFQMAAWGAGVFSTVIKRILRRRRPTDDHTGIRVHIANISGSSFPSGHVLIYTSVYGFFAFLANIWVKSDRMRRSIVGGILGLLTLVGPSRIYLGHHWFTDTVASYLLSTSYLVVLTRVYRRVKRWSLT